MHLNEAFGNSAWSYVIVVDAGGAPNYDPPLVTLALCKPRIRKRAQIGDVILGFCGRRLSKNPHAVRWAGIVAERLSFAEYWEDKRFRNKRPRPAHRSPDNIYRPGKDGLEWVPNNTHRKDAKARDIGGEYVLIFERVWRREDSMPEMPAHFGLRLSSGRRGHRRHEVSDNDLTDLKGWLDTNMVTVEPGRSMASPARKC